MTRELKQEFTARISKANRSQLVVIYYDMLLQYIEEARAGFAAADREAVRDSVKKARACLNSLMDSLDFEHEIAKGLMHLYVFVGKELVNADIRKNPAGLDHAAHVISELREAFLEVAKQDSSAPLMANTQEVYAGLTYGRHALTENISDQGSSRGFRI